MSFFGRRINYAILFRSARRGGPAFIASAAFFYSTRHKNPTTGWTLACGAYCAPKSLPTLDPTRLAKLEGCGEDSFAIAENDFQITIAVADGVGSWRQKGIDPAHFSRSLMRHLEAIVSGEKGWFRAEGTPTESIPPVTLIREAFWRLVRGYHGGREKPFGSSTVCVASLDRTTGELSAANLGDSGFILIRGDDVMLRSRAQQHRFNAPYQLMLTPEGNISDCSNMAARHDCTVETGDVLVMATDGLWDNLFEDDIVKIVKEGTRIGEGPVRLAEQLVGEARRMSEQSQYMSPFSVEAKRAGLTRLGGKTDDITVIVAIPQYIGEPKKTVQSA